MERLARQEYASASNSEVILGFSCGAAPLAVPEEVFLKRIALRSGLIGAALLSTIGYAEAKRRMTPQLEPPIQEAIIESDRADARVAHMRPGEWRKVRNWISSCLAETPLSGHEETAVPIVLHITPNRQLSILPQSASDSRPPGRSKMMAADLEKALTLCGVASMYEPPTREPIDLVMLVNPSTGESRPVQRLK
ncbi:hypothetical protein [uncultured Limimaricola sp.]|uniref:hypothetical protein n=1 Tax=uncultured Limimaricola sp. TaxID=2211667 RepID=UPI0030F65C86